MIIKANKQIGFIYKNNESIDKILKDGEVVFERGFLREKTSTTLPITFGGVGKDLKDYRVYGNTYQNSTTGKNLRYIKDGTAAGVSLTYDNKSGKISIRGTATRTDGILLSEGGGVNIPAGTYTLSVSEPLPVLINSVVSLSSSTNVAFRMPAGNTSVTVNVPSNGVLVGLYFVVTKDVTYDFDCYLQLEQGSEATEFEPYTGGQPSPNPDYPQEIISCGDLITDTTDVNYGKYKIPVNVRSDNIFSNNIIENGYLLEETGTINANSNYYICKETNIKPLNKYILSENQNYAVSTFTPVRVCAYDKDDNFIALLLSNRRTEVKRYVDEFIIPENTDYILIGFRNSDTNIELVESIDTNIYLDEPLRGIGEYSDYIDFINGKVVRNISEVALNGSETWNKNTIPQNIRTERFSSRSPFKHIINIGYCDTFVVKNENMSVYSDTEMFQLSSSADNTFIGILINKDRLASNTVADFVAWLSSNPVTLDYVLLNPTEESITLPNISTVDGNNTLNIETELTPSQVYIKYKSNT